MRMTATTPRAASAARLTRGWTILGLAVASWMAMVGGWLVLSQLFGLVAAAL